jgi:hypothetical protein
MITSEYVPLACNRRGIAHYTAMRDKYLGKTDEALAWQKKVASQLDAARNKGQYEHMAALKKYGGSIVSESINLMLFTSSIVTSMFRLINVRGTDVPAYHLKIIPEIDVWQMSAHGFPNAVNKLSSVTQSIPTPYRISTDRIYQYMPSVLTGNPEPDDDINTRAQYEIEQRIEDDLWDLVAAAVGTFSNAWVYDTRIQDMPTTNELDLSAEGGITVGWMRSLLAAVDKIPARNGSGIVTGQTAKIRNIIIPSNAMQDIRTWVGVVSTVAGGDVSTDAGDSVSATLHADLERRGVAAIDTMWGEKLGIVKSKRLMGTTSANWEKYAWVFLDGPVGRLMVWGDESNVFTHDDRLQDFQEGMSIHKTIAMDIPSPYTPNFLRVQIKP